jgi:hypothetical protein
VPKEAAKGGYGLFSSVKAELSPKKTMPLPPFENPQHPVRRIVCLSNRGEAATPFLRLFLQLLSVGTPTKMEGTCHNRLSLRRWKRGMCFFLRIRGSLHTSFRRTRFFFRSDSPASGFGSNEAGPSRSKT